MCYSSSIATQLWSIQAVHSIRASEIKNRRQAELYTTARMLRDFAQRYALLQQHCYSTMADPSGTQHTRQRNKQPPSGGINKHYHSHVARPAQQYALLQRRGFLNLGCRNRRVNRAMMTTGLRGEVNLCSRASPHIPSQRA